MTMTVTLEELKHFPSGWSLTPYTVYLTLKNCTFDSTLKILEFGSGVATHMLADYLSSKNIPTKYTSYETDSSYAGHPNVNYEFYSPAMQLMKDDNEIYDIVIVDGPNGVTRRDWYHQFKKNVRSGTIILIDDFHHYSEFAVALDENFVYETINEFNIDPRFTPIINVGTELVDVSLTHYHGTKTHKVVKVL